MKGGQGLERQRQKRRLGSLRVFFGIGFIITGGALIIMALIKGL